MEGKIRLAVFGQKRLSREGGIEIVVKELCTRMAQNGCEVTCYNRAGHHVSGAEYDKTIEYDGIRQKVVPTIEKKGLAAVSSSFFAALCSAFGRYDVVHLVNELLRSNSPKKWFRAYFNHGLINYIYGQKRLLPCDMSFDTFFIDPYGDVMPCNGTKDKEVMGNLNNQTWDELWNSPEAEKVRAKVRCCDRDCWMIGSVSPAMHKYIWKPATWVLVHKFKALFTKHPYSMYELKICRDYRDGKVTKEDLDKCSTCDMNCVINNGLSEASKEQLKHKTGEEIVDADIAQQMETK